MDESLDFGFEDLMTPEQQRLQEMYGRLQAYNTGLLHAYANDPASYADNPLVLNLRSYEGNPDYPSDSDDPVYAASCQRQMAESLGISHANDRNAVPAGITRNDTANAEELHYSRVPTAAGDEQVVPILIKYDRDPDFGDTYLPQSATLLSMDAAAKYEKWVGTLYRLRDEFKVSYVFLKDSGLADSEIYDMVDSYDQMQLLKTAESPAEAVSTAEVTQTTEPEQASSEPASSYYEASVPEEPTMPTIDFDRLEKLRQTYGKRIMPANAFMAGFVSEKHKNASIESYKHELATSANSLPYEQAQALISSERFQRLIELNARLEQRKFARKIGYFATTGLWLTGGSISAGTVGYVVEASPEGGYIGAAAGIALGGFLAWDGIRQKLRKAANVEDFNAHEAWRRPAYNLQTQIDQEMDIATKNHYLLSDG